MFQHYFYQYNLYWLYTHQVEQLDVLYNPEMELVTQCQFIKDTQFLIQFRKCKWLETMLT